nr:hypothetical protein [Tanacetum cinerariifolium]
MTGMRIVMAMRGCGGVEEMAAARGGEWCGGSSRSGWEECFWGSSKKFSGDGGRRWPAVAGGEEAGGWLKV